MANRQNNRAVTLIEMLVVLGIILVLAGIVVTATLRVDTRSKENALDNAFALLGTSLREYFEVKDEFPEQPERNTPANAVEHIEKMVRELRSVPDSRHVLDQINHALFKSEAGDPDVPELRDPWGTVLDYVYDPNGGDSFPELISAGRDKQFGTGDDIDSKGRPQN